MKRKFLVLGAIVIFMASFSKANLTTEKVNVVGKATHSSTLQMTEGEKLINKSDCSGCHTKLNKIIGPSYADVALKYPATEKNINILADRIIKGSTGVWGTLPMTAHPTLKKEDAKKMIKYILTVKK